MDTNTTIIISILLVIVVLFSLFGYIMLKRQHGYWKCTEQGCERDIDGIYKNKNECMQACQPEDKLDAWACTSGYQCVKAADGYTTKELCESNCGPKYTTTYFPQTLLSPYLHYRRYPRHRRFRKK